MRGILLKFFVKYKGDWDAIYHALENKEKFTLHDLTEFENKYDMSKYITILDSDYPNDLKEAHKPPFVLYKGAKYTIDEMGKHTFENGIFQAERDVK